MLSEVELAFGENLLLLGGITGPRLSYALRARQGDSRALWELVAQLSLAQGRAVAEAHRLAEAAMQVAGPSAFSFSTGAMVGPWELVDRTGVGIGGEVWSATRPGGEVATLRVVPPGTGRDPERTLRFVERSNVGLDPPHPSLLKIDEGDEDFGWLYAATIGLECRPLAAMMSHGPVDEQTALALAQSVVGSLSVVHELGVVHGGLGSMSVLVRDQRVYLSDFGVSAAGLDGPAFGSRPGGRLGILLYASPELIRGDAERGLDARDDLYALGALLYHAVCGATPQDQRCAPTAPWPVEPPVSPGFKQLLAGLLAPEGARYASAQQVMGELARVSAGQAPSPPQPAGPVVRGRRHPTAGPQQVVTPEMLADEPAAPAPLQSLAPPPAVDPLPVTPQPSAPAPPAEPEEELAEDEEWEYEEEEEAKSKPRKSSVEAPSIRQRASDRFAAAPAAKQGGGWIVFLVATVVTLGGLGAAYALTLPTGTAKADALLAQALVQSSGEAKPDFGLALRSARQALDLYSDPAGLRDALREWEAVQARALAARAALVPQGNAASTEDLIKVRDRLAELLVRSEGTWAATLLRYDLARCGDTIDLPTWQAIARDLLREGRTAEGLVAAEKGSKKDLLELARIAERLLVHVRGGPYLWPDEKDPSELVVRERPALYLGRSEVTRKTYAEFLSARAAGQARVDARIPADKQHAPSGWDPQRSKGSLLPATGVDLQDAVACATWLGLVVADADALQAAARGPLHLSYPWGQARPTLVFVNAGGELESPAPAGSFPGGRAPCGALDLLGNVAELTLSGRALGSSQPFGGSYATPSEALGPSLGEALALEDQRGPEVGFRLMVLVE